MNTIDVDPVDADIFTDAYEIRPMEINALIH